MNGSVGPNGEGAYGTYNAGTALPAPAQRYEYFLVHPSGFASSYTPTFNASYSSAWSNNWPGDGQASSVNGYGYNYTQGSSELPMMYNFWIDQQPDVTSPLPHTDVNYPPMILQRPPSQATRTRRRLLWEIRFGTKRMETRLSRSLNSV